MDGSETGRRSDQRAKVGVWEWSAIVINTFFLLFCFCPYVDWHGSRGWALEVFLCISYWIEQP